MPRVAQYQCKHGDFVYYLGDLIIGESLRRYGEWAEEEIALLASLIQPGSTFIDVGSHAGTHTVPIARAVGSNGRVVSIEANPQTYSLLCCNILQNDLTENVFALNAVVGRKIGTLTHGINRLPDQMILGAENFRQDVASAAAAVSVTLPILTVDSLKLDRCDLIKIDAEGMELDVLLGAQQTLANQPRLYFEQHPDFTVNFAEIYDLLRTFGYRLYWHVTSPFNPCNFNGEQENMFGTFSEVNVLALQAKHDAPVGLKEITAPIYAPAPADGHHIRSESVPAVSRPHFNPLVHPFTQALQSDIEDCNLQLGRARADLQAILSSTSWRVTRPLRWIKNRLGIGSKLNKSLEG